MIAALRDTFVSSLVKRFLVELERVPTLSRYGRHRLRASPFKGCLYADALDYRGPSSPSPTIRSCPSTSCLIR
jgi:hypothetical protein